MRQSARDLRRKSPHFSTIGIVFGNGSVIQIEKAVSIVLEPISFTDTELIGKLGADFGGIFGRSQPSAWHFTVVIYFWRWRYAVVCGKDNQGIALADSRADEVQ